MHKEHPSAIDRPGSLPLEARGGLELPGISEAGEAAAKDSWGSPSKMESHENQMEKYKGL